MNKLVAVAIDKDKSSQSAFRWAIDHLLLKGQTVVLIHVKVKPGAFASSPSVPGPRSNQISNVSDDMGPISSDTNMQARELFLPFRCFCTRKDIQCHDVLLEDTDVVTAIIDFVNQTGIDVLVLGAPSKGGLFRFKAKDIPGSVSKGVPDFCTVYIISKMGKMSSTKSASRQVSFHSPLRNQVLYSTISKHEAAESPPPSSLSTKDVPRPTSQPSPTFAYTNANSIKSPFLYRKAPNGKPYGDVTAPDTDISYVSTGRLSGSGRPSSSGPNSSSNSRPSIDPFFPSFAESYEMGGPTPRLSYSSDADLNSFESWNFDRKSVDATTPPELSYMSMDSDYKSYTSNAMDDVEAEMRRLKLELKQTMDMYSTACKEALSAKQKAMELQRWKIEEQQRLEEARLAEEAALAIAEKEKARSKAAIEHAQAAQRIAELEAQKRISAEMKALKEAEEKNKVLNQLAHSDYRYRRYSIEEIEAATQFFAASRKIGEGGYGPVYKCYLDHTAVAVKVLRPDAAHGRSQFQQEVEVLSCIRHPNMVLLLGACPEYGCLVYEYMSNGSLDDCLFHRGNSPTLSWQHRFRIAAEIGRGLLFLHQSKPEPLVHRDLKPANILLDRNYVSKISDVGLARLVPPSVADSVTQYLMTSTAGTFCYIDPEYQQTGMLGIKSDIYSLGILFLQIITAKPPMGLTHHVERAIEKGNFASMLDPAVPDWPVEEALGFAKLALQCAELRRKDRPDLSRVVMPELERLRAIADESMGNIMPNCVDLSPGHSQVSVSQESVNFPVNGHSGYDSTGY